jgi:hypothetical protein
MLRDVFYFGNKPNVHPREQFAKNLVDARKKTTTEHFWIINEFCDYTGFDWDFDFEFLPDEDVWAESHNNVWPSVHQKDSGTWLCPKKRSDVIVYRADVNQLKRKQDISSNWKILENIDKNKWDFSWHPDPTDPPYIYKWGSKYAPVEFKSCIEYHCDGATQIKYMNNIVELLPNYDCIVEVQKVDKSRWDMSWRPDPLDPPYIYVWGNKYIDGNLRSTLEYHVPGATEKKYMPELVPVLPEWDRWHILHDVDKTSFDFTWRPDPREPDFIYIFGNEQYDSTVMPTLEYRMPEASVKKYVTNVKVKLASHPEKFEHLEKADGIDYSWVPDPTAPPYIYAWGNQWNKPEDKISIQYVVDGATEYKYMEPRANRKPSLENWEIPDNIDTTSFDFSWEPSPADPPYIYQFGTQWQKTGGPRYVVSGATEVKYIDFQKAKALPNKKNWTVPNNLDIKGFDFSWHPDDTSPPYVYHFATQWALTGGPIYKCEGATEVKYLDHPSAIALPDKTNWEIPDDIDVDSFDFSWHPYVEDQPYVYVFGTQHQKTGGPKYITPGVIPTSPVKYIDTRILKATKLPNKKNFSILNNYKIKDFDFSWHPDETDEPYIYVFGNNQYAAEIMPTIEYNVKGAKQVKYISDVVAVLDNDKNNWKIPKDLDVSNFDFSWKPNPKDPPYIYQFGTQHQKTGGPRYVVPDATEIKYVSTQQAIKLPNKKKFAILNNLVVENFDYSWHPDDTEEPFIYQFGNNLYPAEIMPTVEYVVKGGTQIKYVNTITATLGVDKNNWEIPDNIDVSNIDFRWKPNPKDPPYIYQFGTQHQKTGGPRYEVADATHIKYIDNPKVTAKPMPERFNILNDYVIKDFDYSWHPDETDEPYIYVFGNNQYPPEIMPTIEYAMEGATQIKYVTSIAATLGVDMKYWEIPENVDVSNFDFSWKPNPKDPALIYEFGTQWQKTGGPKYIVPNATEVKYVDTQKAVSKSNMQNWTIPNHVDVSNFDFSWHPDSTSPPYIYHFATQWALTGGPIYKCEGATEVKYVEFPSAIALPNQDNWEVPSTVDESKFDFSWHPYIEDQPYIYQFGTQHQKTGGPRYITPGVIPTSPVKYIDTRIIKATRIPDKRNFSILNNYKIKDFDWSWHPDETDEPYIYVFGNTQFPAEIMPTIEYVVKGAKQIKYVTDVVAILDVDMTNWDIPKNIDTTGFDFSWKPNPKDPPFIYQFGTQWQKTGGPRYIVPEATEVKYVTSQQVKALPSKNNWTIPDHVDVSNFDFSWHPDDTSPPYIYHFATQWALTGGPIYTVEGAKETKYLEEPSAIALTNKENWEIPSYIDETQFDFSWHPYIEDQPYVYVFGTQHQKTGGPKYITPGVIPTSPVKYIDTRILKAVRKQDKSKFSILNNYKIKNFDWSWHPDETDEPYIYVFGNNQYSAEIMPTIEYAVPGAKQIKYVNDLSAVLDIDMANWEVPNNIDTTGFDFSWKPNPKDPPYIYQFGTQWQKTGGPRYVVPDATEVKYVSTQQVKALVTHDNWTIPENIDVTNFDFSWHPDDTSPPYIYHFATQWALTGGPIYTVPNASEKKYLEEPCAIALANQQNWEIPNDVDVTEFDFSWHPYIEDQPYIYQFGTQWQKTGGPRYITPGVIPSSPIKYIDTRILKAKKLANKKNFAILNNYKIKDFDYSWHPDQTDEPYIYVFGNNQHPAEVMPTIEYVVPGAKQVKYVSEIVATLDVDMTNWQIPPNIDVSHFDFSWKPNPKDPAYIYEFGTQWQKTGGPKYIVEGATETKYVSTQQAIALPTKDNWTLPSNVDVTNFDFSWHPDATSPPYNYHFATQWALSGGPVYKMKDAKETKYMEQPCAVALPNKNNWEIPSDIDSSSFDFSWHPYSEDSPYIYQFGTQHQKTGGPRYITPGSKRSAPIKYIDTRILKATKLPNRNNFEILNNLKVLDFDWSWHPDSTDGEFIYVFGNTQYSAEVMPTIQYKSSPYAEKIKYINDVVATLASDKSNWIIPDGLDTLHFDFSWVPNPNDPPYIYQFGTQWQKTGGPRYVVPGASEVKYVDDVKATMLPTKRNWIVPKNIDASNFDFSWHPDDTESIYIYEFGTQWQKTGGPKYVPSKADETTPIKYIDVLKVNKLPEKQNFTIYNNIAVKDFDWTWHPDETDEAYIYIFGNNQYAPEDMPTIEYKVPGATQKKYVHNPVATLAPDTKFWKIPTDIDIDSFDFSWKPNPNDPPYIYQFGTQHQKTGGPTYIAKNATDNSPVKYVDTQFAKKLAGVKNNFEILNNYKIKDFDYSWHPDETEEPFVYIFGNSQYPAEIMPTIRYTVPGATQVKYINSIIAILDNDKTNWVIPETISNNFDYSWKPNPKDPPYIYQFGTQHQKTGGPKYIVPNATEVKYIDEPKSVRKVIMDNWEIPKEIDVSDFDFSWHPDDLAPPYIYQFGTFLNDKDGPRYFTPNNTGEVVYKNRVIKPKEVVNNLEELADEVITPMTQNIVFVPEYFIETTLDDLVKEHPNEVFWALNPELDYDNFDFSWRPNIEQVKYIHAFGSSESKDTQTYFVNAMMYNQGYKDINYVDNLKLTEEILYFLYKKPDLFFVDRGNKESNERFTWLQSKFGRRIQKTRYLNSWVDTINRCINRSTSNLCWILNSELDYSDFNFEFYPNPWQTKMVHVFGTQWSHWGTTFMVNRNTFANDTKWIKIIEHLSNLNFVKSRIAKATNILYDVFYIDHGNLSTEQLIELEKSNTVIPYDTDYLITFKNILSKLPEKKEHYIWIASTICDYSEFDFTYICDPFAREQLHVFPSDRQKFGDTFLVNVNKLRELVADMESLKDYEKINYNQHQRTKRLESPVIVTEFDTHVASVMEDFNFPYATFVTKDNKDIKTVDDEPMSLWDAESKTILVTSTGGTKIIVPKEAKQYVETQLYDYPYIKSSTRLAKSNPLDIVYLSNGEVGADENYEHLLKITKGLTNKIVRVDGVKGRVEAYHAAAEASNTPWMFTVFAKLKVNPKFDFNWQPDRLQIPKHYMFLAKNPVNGLIYGHQGMIAYNKDLVLNNEGHGLDFTLDSPHETIELLSGTAHYNTDEFSTWRTAFREVIKLKQENSEISLQRLNTWLTKAEGDYAEYSIHGAVDGLEYYEKSKGKLDKLRKSYEWDWLRKQFIKKYKKK